MACSTAGVTAAAVPLAGDTAAAAKLRAHMPAAVCTAAVKLGSVLPPAARR